MNKVLRLENKFAAEAATVRRIFYALADGKGTLVIARELNEEWIPTWTESYKGLEAQGKWRSNNIIAIAKNEFYTGDSLYDRSMRERGRQPCNHEVDFPFRPQHAGRAELHPEAESPEHPHHFSSFLGYRRGDKPGTYEIVPAEAEIVRRIYRQFLEGYSPKMIADRLMEDGICTPSGGEKWYPSTVASILEKLRTTDFIRCTR